MCVAVYAVLEKFIMSWRAGDRDDCGKIVFLVSSVSVRRALGDARGGEASGDARWRSEVAMRGNEARRVG